MNKHRYCMKISEDLKFLQTQCNNGRGLSCVDTMIMYLDADYFHTAKVVATNEWDKISGYPILAKYIQSNIL